MAGGTPFRQAHHTIASQVREATHRPPWDVARSLDLRRLDVSGAADAVRGEAAGLAEWAARHPPPLPT